MNVNELQSYVYKALATGNVGADSVSSQGKVSFSSALDEEVSKIAENYKDIAINGADESKKVAEFKELADILDGSILGTMTKNATDSDLQKLSEDLLGTGGGREVLSKLMEGHFNSIVLSDSDEEDHSEDIVNKSVDSYNETVSETQALIDGLEKVSANLQK